MNREREEFLDRLNHALDEGEGGDLPDELYRKAAYDAELRSLMEEVEEIDVAARGIEPPPPPADLSDRIMQRVREEPKPASAASHRSARVIVYSFLATAAAIFLAMAVGVISLLLDGNEPDPASPEMIAEASPAPNPQELQHAWPGDQLTEAVRSMDEAGAEARRTATGLLGSAAGGLSVFLVSEQPAAQPSPSPDRDGEIGFRDVALDRIPC